MRKIIISIFSFVLILTSFSIQPQSASAARDCQGLFFDNKGDAYVNIQTNTSLSLRSIQWGFNFTNSGKTNFAPQARVALPTAKVNDTLINSPYAPHTESPNYNFHGSMMNYQVKLTGTNKSLLANDLVSFHFRASTPASNNTNTTAVSFTCRVP